MEDICKCKQTFLTFHHSLTHSTLLQGMEQQFHALRRLVASKAGFTGFTNFPGFREKIGVKVNKALKLGKVCPLKVFVLLHFPSVFSRHQIKIIRIIFIRESKMIITIRI